MFWRGLIAAVPHTHQPKEIIAFYRNFAMIAPNSLSAVRTINMKTSIALAILFLGWAVTAWAVIYEYTDDSGQIHYTNDLATVPAEKLDQVTEIKETESGPAAPASSYSGTIYPLLQDSQSARDKEREQERAEKKAQLEAEYKILLEQKEALDNDESFQKRRNKKKYQNRPYIQELIAKEARIKQRLMEVERELKYY